MAASRMAMHSQSHGGSLQTDPRYHDPPAPAPGSPLLTDSELEKITHDLNTFDNNPLYSEYGEGWTGLDYLQLPPGDYVGSFTHQNGQQPPHHLAHASLSSQYYMHPSPSVPTIMPPTTLPLGLQPLGGQQPVLNIIPQAATFPQHALTSRPESSSHGLVYKDSPVGPALGSLVGTLSHQSMDQFLREQSQNMLAVGGSNFPPDFGAMYRGQPAQPTRRTTQDAGDVRFGSDDRFNPGQSFVAATPTETSEHMEKDHLRYMGCLKTDRNISHPPSPRLKPSALRILKTRDPVKVEQGTDALPRRRRKSNAYNDDDNSENDDSDDAPSLMLPGRKRRRNNGSILAESPGGPRGVGKRRKSSVNGAGKQPRENLSKEQKKINHIESEQRRRRVIKQGFQDLSVLVPELSTCDPSRAAVLQMAADFVEKMIQGNADLQKQLDRLEDS